jgi:site-specific DNA-methyltransferase (adenine-specific)
MDTPQTTPISAFLGQVICGDCISVMQTMPSESVDFALTDPPYIVHFQDRSGRRVSNDDNDRWLQPAFSKLFRVLKKNTYCISFYGWNTADRFLKAWRQSGFIVLGHFVFVKRYASFVRRVQMKHEQAYLLAKGNPFIPEEPPGDVLPWRYTGNRLHPTQKPVSTLLPLIHAFSKPNDIILDPFCGSGTTGVAAHQCGRRYVLIEKNAEYCQAAARRLQSPDHSR